MPVVSENTEMLLTCAPEVLDPVLISFGFRRAQRSLVYARDFPEAKQELSLTYDSSPRYGLGAKIHLHPTFQIRMPEIAVEALQMTEDPCRFGTGDVIIGWPVDFLAPRSEHQRWFVSDAASCRLALEDIAAIFHQWVEPFLRDYTSPNELLRQYEAGDKRLVQPSHFFVFIAACYRRLGQSDKAAQVLARHLGKPGLRKVYAKAFDSVLNRNTRLAP
jgi:hypothetical protein